MLASTEKYPLIMRGLHWLIALMIIGLLVLGLYMAALPHDAPNRNDLYLLHKSVGVTVLGLAFIRLICRLTLEHPALPDSIPKLQRVLAELGHWALYGFMFLMPVSGYVMSTSYGLTVKWFGITLPKLIGINKDRGMLAADIHKFAAYALIAMLVAHVGAVVLHYLQHRVNLLKRMA